MIQIPINKKLRPKHCPTSSVIRNVYGYIFEIIMAPNCATCRSDHRILYAIPNVYAANIYIIMLAVSHALTQSNTYEDPLSNQCDQ